MKCIIVFTTICKGSMVETSTTYTANAQGHIHLLGFLFLGGFDVASSAFAVMWLRRCGSEISLQAGRYPPCQKLPLGRWFLGITQAQSNIRQVYQGVMRITFSFWISHRPGSAWGSGHCFTDMCLCFGIVKFYIRFQLGDRIDSFHSLPQILQACVGQIEDQRTLLDSENEPVEFQESRFPLMKKAR